MSKNVFDIVIPKGQDIRTASGSKVIYRGELVEEVTEIEILPMTVSSVLMVKITVPLGNITSE